MANWLDSERDYKEQRRLYSEEDDRLHNLFVSTLEKFYEVEDHPKKSRLFSIAWDYGHSNGLEEVVNHYETLVELIK